MLYSTESKTNSLVGAFRADWWAAETTVSLQGSLSSQCSHCTAGLRSLTVLFSSLDQQSVQGSLTRNIRSKCESLDLDHSSSRRHPGVKPGRMIKTGECNQRIFQICLYACLDPNLFKRKSNKRLRAQFQKWWGHNEVKWKNTFYAFTVYSTTQQITHYDEIWMADSIVYMKNNNNKNYIMETHF